MSCPPRFATPRSERESLGGQVAKVARRLGRPLMPWQRAVVDTAMEVDPDTGRLVYSEIVLTVPRQSGKSYLLLVVRVARAVLPHFDGAQSILHTAQSRVAARTKLTDEHHPLLQRSPFAGAYRLRLSTGQESLHWRSGSRDAIIAAELSSGHGETCDLFVCDEFWAQSDHRLEQALKPTQLTRPQPQSWFVSTAGRADLSVPLRQKVDAGRERASEASTAGGVAYFEWSADEALDPGDVSVWRQAMPALGHTVEVSSVAGDYSSMEVDEFRRSHLNQWTEAPAGAVFEPGVWAALAEAGVRTEGRPAFSFDTNPERSHSAIAAASESDGRTVVEVVEHRPGTAWLPPRLAELCERWDPKLVVCDGAGPAGSLLTALDDAGVEVKVANVSDYKAAVGQFYDAVCSGALVHADQAPLNEAVAAADRRTVGDAWLWSRRSSSADISPLVAVTLAHWALHQAGPPTLTPMMAWT